MRKAIAIQADPPSEKTEEFWADKTARMLGYEVKNLSQRRRSKVALGLPDRIYAHRAYGIFVWAELKRETGKPSEKQKDFHAMLRDCGQLVVVGTANVVGEFLVERLKERATK
jgi:hypothetical protein